jgi:hypothetical protein
MRPRTPLIAATVLLAAGIATAPAGGAGSSGTAAQTFSGAGVGPVKLGKTFRSLRDAGHLGQQRPGCELAGPGTRAAKLKAPLKGFVDLTRQSPRRVAAISLRGGAKARGVGIGSTIPQIRAAFPGATVDRSTEGTFQLTLVKVSKAAGGKFQFGVDTQTDKTTIVGIPRIRFCE